MDASTSLKAQLLPQRPTPISLRAQSNVETKAAARKGLLNIMMNKFSSTPLSLHESNELNNPSSAVEKEMMKLRHKRLHSTDHDKADPCLRHELDMYQYDASLTKSEREYIRHIILSGDTNSIQSASVVLQNEDVFPVHQQLLFSKSSSNATTASGTTNDEANGYDDSCADASVIANEEEDDDETVNSTTDDYHSDEKKDDTIDVHPGIDVTRNIDPTNTLEATPALQQHPPSVRDSMIQQQLFRLHETNKDLQPNELIQRMSRQNSILTIDDSTNALTAATGAGSNVSSFRHCRSMSPPPITEDEVLLVSAPSLNIDNETRTSTPKNNDSIHQSDQISVEGAITSIATDVIDNDDTNIRIQPETSPTVHETVVNVDATILNSSWNPFDDISSWLDGSQGVEVTATTSTQTIVHGPTVDIHTSQEEGLTLMSSDSNQPIVSVDSSKANQISNVTSSAAQQPFRILGTSADDVSCHPHVLSPPLMESLLAFVPEYQSHHHYASIAGITSDIASEGQHLVPDSNKESIANATIQRSSDVFADNKDGNKVPTDCRQFTCQNDTTTNANEGNTNPCMAATSVQQQQRHQQFVASSLMHSSMSTNSSTSNFWLKYSLVRDGPGLWIFLRQVRASAICILAIETTEGHVFGAYTSQPWRLSKGWYGNKDTFLWKMRRSRLETAGKSILQQIYQESEIQVYPYRAGNVAVQYCSNKCLMLGQGEVIPSPKKHNPKKPPPSNVGKHYGYALYLDKDLTSGTTSSSETFGNPCLLDSSQRGARFNVANIEVWTLTPHSTVAEAEQSELSNLFLDGGRDSAHRLNFMNILVGGPI